VQPLACTDSLAFPWIKTSLTYLFFTSGNIMLWPCVVQLIFFNSSIDDMQAVVFCINYAGCSFAFYFR
jgi:hypothetical protein